MTDKFVFNQNGDAVFKELDKKYNKHKKGYVILGPMAIGKTHWMDSQKPKKGKVDWLDQDEYLLKIGAINWDVWKNPRPNSTNYKLQYMRADYGTTLAKSLGYRMIGSNFLTLVPDAIVIIPEDLHQIYMGKRNKSKKFRDNIGRVKNMLEIIAKNNKVPVFPSVEEAVNFLEKKK
jgi:hypothetical protein